MTRAPIPVLAVVVALAGPACSGGTEAGTGEGTESPAEVVAGVTTVVTVAPDEDPEENEDPDLELAGTAWRLTSIERGGKAVDTSRAEVPAVLSFDEQEVEAYDGLNTAVGAYRAEGSTLSVELTDATSFGYPGDALPQYRLLAELPSARSARVEGSTLQISTDDGTVLGFDLASGSAPG